MNSGFIYVAIGCFVVVSAWSILLSVTLDRANKEITKLKKELLDTVPF